MRWKRGFVDGHHNLPDDRHCGPCRGGDAAVDRVDLWSGQRDRDLSFAGLLDLGDRLGHLQGHGADRNLQLV